VALDAAHRVHDGRAQRRLGGFAARLVCHARDFVDHLTARGGVAILRGCVAHHDGRDDKSFREE
jgi:hypothetical protein